MLELTFNGMKPCSLSDCLKCGEEDTAEDIVELRGAAEEEACDWQPDHTWTCFGNTWV